MSDYIKNQIKQLDINNGKIEFKTIKEKKCTRTYIFNLQNFITDTNILEKVITDLKKSLGTSCIKKETDFGVGYGFNGNFSARITEFLLEKKYVSKDAFKR